MWKWFQEVRKRNIPLSGPVIKAKALKYATDLEIEDFKASEGWLDKFKARHNIKFKQISGESASVDLQEPYRPDDDEIEIQDEQNEKRVIKSKKELRTLLDEYEYYIIEQEPNLMVAFKRFQTAFLDNSKAVCRQTTLHSFFRTLDH